MSINISTIVPNIIDTQNLTIINSLVEIPHGNASKLYQYLKNILKIELYIKLIIITVKISQHLLKIVLYLSMIQDLFFIILFTNGLNTRTLNPGYMILLTKLTVILKFLVNKLIYIFFRKNINMGNKTSSSSSSSIVSHDGGYATLLFNAIKDNTYGDEFTKILRDYYDTHINIKNDVIWSEQC